MFVGGAVGCASIGDYESILSMGPSYECPLAKKSINWQNYVRHTHSLIAQNPKYTLYTYAELSQNCRPAPRM